MLRTIVVVFLFANVSGLVFGQAESDPKDDAIGSLSELTILRDDVQKRFALFIIGETHEVKEGKPPRTTRQFMIRAANSSANFNYSAYAFIAGADSTGLAYDKQSWFEQASVGTKIKARRASGRGGEYLIKPKGIELLEFLDSENIFETNFDPFDDLVIHPMFLRNPTDNRAWIEKVYLKESKLLSASRGVQDTIQSKWKWDFAVLHYEIDMVQAKAFSYLPTEVKFKNSMPWLVGDFGHTRIEWRKNSKGQYLPYRLEASTGDANGTRLEQCYYRYFWKVGDEIGDEVFDFDSTDLRLPFSKYFNDFQFDTTGPNGFNAGTLWEAPEDLYGKSDMPSR